MQLWSAILLGIGGSLHCAVMCGPLLLALRLDPSQPTGRLSPRLFYHGGRLAAYAMVGLLMGAIGHSVALAGWQNWLSIAAGAAILLMALAPSRWTSIPAQPIHWAKSRFLTLLQKRTGAAWFVLGGLNGLLPCGLVYVAATASISTGNILAGFQYMLLFGVGTLPMLLGVAVIGHNLQARLRSCRMRIIPLCAVLTGMLLIFRGFSAGPCH